MKVNFVILLFSSVLSTALAVPTIQSSLAPRSIPAWEFYYNVTSAQHQTYFNKWSGAGYRMISLSVYGQPPNHLYAAVWVQRLGSSYFAIHEASGSAYQSFFDSHVPDGFVSTIVTVTGPSSTPIFAGVMEQNGVTNWYQKCGLTNSQYTTELSNAQANRYILKSFTEYGSPSDRLYCAVWYYNDQLDNYTTFVDESYSAYQTTFNAETAKPSWRPSYLSISEDHEISSTFVDTNVGAWVARHGMTASDLESEDETQKAAGLYLIHLQGGGTGSNANFAALWATQDIPTPRTGSAITSTVATMGTTTTPVVFTSPTSSTDQAHKGAPIGAIVGGAVGGVLVVAAMLIFWLLLCLRRKRDGTKYKPNPEPPSGYGIVPSNAPPDTRVSFQDFSASGQPLSFPPAPTVPSSGSHYGYVN